MKPPTVLRVTAILAALQLALVNLVQGQCPTDNNKFNECFSNLRDIEISSVDAFDTFCRVGPAAYTCASGVVKNCRSINFIVDVSSRAFQIPALCTDDNKAAYKQSECRSNAVTSEIESCVNNFTNGEKECRNLRTLWSCVTTNCGLEAPDVYCSMMESIYFGSLRTTQRCRFGTHDPFFDHDGDCSNDYRTCLAHIQNATESGSFDFFFEEGYCWFANQSLTCGETVWESCPGLGLEFTQAQQSASDLTNYICDANNKGELNSLKSCLGSDGSDIIYDCFTPFNDAIEGASTPSAQCSVYRELFSCILNDLERLCGREVKNAGRTFLRSYAKYRFASTLDSSCDAFSILNGGHRVAAPLCTIGFVVTALIIIQWAQGL